MPDRIGNTRARTYPALSSSQAHTPARSWPAGGRSVGTSKPSLVRSQAVPTRGWPANGSSSFGVKMRSLPCSGSSTNTVSEKPRTAAVPWRSPSATCPPSRKTPRGLPPAPPSPTNTRSTCSLGTPGGSSAADLTVVTLPLLTAPDVLLDLAGRRLGELAELDGRRGLEAGDPLLDELY